MSTNFPSSKDTPKNDWSNSDYTVDILASELNNNADAVSALQDKVGVDSSADTSSLDYKVTNTSSVSPGHKHVLNDNTDVDTTGVSDGQLFVYELASGKWKPNTSSTPNASSTVAGKVELATNAEVEAGTATGGSGAALVVTADSTHLPSDNEMAAIAGNGGTPSSSNKFVTQTGVQNNTESYATSGGSAGAYTLTLSPAPTAYTIGMVVYFKANHQNTGAATLNVNSLGAVTIKKKYNNDLAASDIQTGQIVCVAHDGTYFQILSVIPIGVRVCSASDDLVVSADTERSETSTSYTPKKSILALYGGTVRVKFDLKSTNSSESSSGVVYISGVLSGTERTTTLNTYTTYSQDFLVNPGDRIELYTKRNSGAAALCANFRVYYVTATYQSPYAITD